MKRYQESREMPLGTSLMLHFYVAYNKLTQEAIVQIMSKLSLQWNPIPIILRLYSVTSDKKRTRNSF
jgi:hypothetical protein